MTLLEACEHGDYGETQDLLQSAPEAIDQPDPEGWTALMFACDNGHLSTAQLLLEHGADVNRASLLGTTSLMIACAAGFTDIVCLLLDHDARAGMQARSGWTALMEACSGGYVDTARLLLERGANAKQASQHGDTALIRACMRGDMQLVQLLCCYGAEREAHDRHGNTAIDAARAFARRPDPLDNQHLEIAAWLEATKPWVTPLHHVSLLEPAHARHLLARGGDAHARASSSHPSGLPTTAPSPLELAEALEREGRAPDGSAAALLLAWWRERLVAFAMGTHSRLGAESPVHKCACAPELIELIVAHWRGRA